MKKNIKSVQIPPLFQIEKYASQELLVVVNYRNITVAEFTACTFIIEIVNRFWPS